MNTTVLIEKGQDGKFSVYAPDINITIIGQGDSVADAKKDFENSFSAIIANYGDRKLPEELQGIEFEYKYDVASVFNYYSFINVTRFAKLAGINSSLMRQYKSGVTYISGQQAERIEKQLHLIGKELCSVHL